MGGQVQDAHGASVLLHGRLSRLWPEQRLYTIQLGDRASFDQSIGQGRPPRAGLPFRKRQHGAVGRGLPLGLNEGQGARAREVEEEKLLSKSAATIGKRR